MQAPLIRRVGAFAFVASLAMVYPAMSHAQAPKPPPATTKKPVVVAPVKPPTTKPAVPPVAVAPKVAPPADVRFTSKYTTSDQVTESVTYLQNNRERYDLADMILLRQHDQQRVIQISRASKTYLVTPEGLPATPAASSSVAPRPPGVVIVATSIVDTGERKAAFGQQARHVKTMIDRQPQPGACDATVQRIETDAWYIDAPKSMAAQQENTEPAASAGCRDEIKATQNGDPKVLGFPISYSTTFLDGEGKPVVVAMEVTEFEVTTLDAALFEIPAGLTAAMNPQDLAKAVSNANEAKLAAGESTAGVVNDKKAGVIRVGVPEVANRTTQPVDTRALRTLLIAELADAKMEAVPMAAAPRPELDARATQLGVDYLLVAEITELKASKPGGLSRMMKATAGESSAGKDITEAKLTVQLVAPGAKPRLSTTTSGKDGGVGLKTGLGIAKVAGTMYMKMTMGGMYGSPMGAFNTMSVMNMGGMGMLGDPSLTAGLGGGTRMGMGLDRTAGAASFLMEQAMVGSGGGPQQGPSFDAPLGDALKDAAEKVVETLEKPDPAKKK